MAFLAFNRFLVFLLFSFRCLREVNSTSFKGSVDDGEEIFLFSNFFTFPHHKLYSTAIDPRSVDSEDDCVEACTENSQCRSLNFSPVPTTDGKFICDLLDTDKFTSPDSKFQESSDFHHYSFTAPCDLSPCKNNGTCYPVTGKYDFECACLPKYWGKRCELLRYKNCAELLNDGFNKSGVYSVQLSHDKPVSEMVYCDQTSSGGGWTMVFKVVSGVSHDIYQLWSSADSLNENKTEALNISSYPLQHYKNRLVPNWQMANPKEARVALYENENEVFSIVFDARNTDNESWFSANRVISSPWTDLSSNPPTYFIIPGTHNRHFYIAGPHDSCGTDSGWLVVHSTGCPWEQRFPSQTVMYSKLKNSTNWNVYGGHVSAEIAFIVSLGTVCSMSPPRI